MTIMKSLGKLLVATTLLSSVNLAWADQVTLRVADQKGNMRAQLEAAGKLDNLPYKIEWSEFPAAAPLAEALNAQAVDVGIIGDAPLLFAEAAGAQVKAIAVSSGNVLVSVNVMAEPTTVPWFTGFRLGGSQ